MIIFVIENVLLVIGMVEVMKKKFSTDFMFKESFVWIQPDTKSLHWGKSAAQGDRSHAKYVFLDRTAQPSEGSRPAGEMKGVLKRVDINGLSITLHLESGEYLELRVGQEGQGIAQKRAADWVKVLRSFLSHA